MHNLSTLSSFFPLLSPLPTNCLHFFFPTRIELLWLRLGLKAGWELLPEWIADHLLQSIKILQVLSKTSVALPPSSLSLLGHCQHINLLSIILVLHIIDTLLIVGISTSEEGLRLALRRLGYWSGFINNYHKIFLAKEAEIGKWHLHLFVGITYPYTLSLALTFDWNFLCQLHYQNQVHFLQAFSNFPQGLILNSSAWTFFDNILTLWRLILYSSFIV